MTRWKVGLNSAACFVVVMAGLEFLPAPLPASPVAPAPARRARACPVDPAAILPPLAALPTQREAPGGVFELTLRSAGIADLEGQLLAAGAEAGDARRAVALLRPQVGEGFATDADVKLSLGAEVTPGRRPIMALAVITDLGPQRVVRGPAGLDLAAPARVRRVSARIDGGSYWSLRAAGVAPDIAREAASLADRRLGAEQGSEIEAVIGERPARFGSATSARLLYVAVERAGRPARRLLAMPGEGAGWVDPDRPAAVQAVIARPVAGRVTSSFGARFHPILHFFRPHRGLDFAARSGEPVRAVADGCVTGASWRGGYGRQVRLAHRDALASSYSHLADYNVRAGQCVRRGEVIGQAGASGLATGPHLHFEVYRGGRPVDPAPLAVGAGCERRGRARGHRGAAGADRTRLVPPGEQRGGGDPACRGDHRAEGDRVLRGEAPAQCHCQP